MRPRIASSSHGHADRFKVTTGDRTEKKLYRHWIRHALPHLSEVYLASDLTGDRFYIISGDSEEWSYAEKLAEITEELARAERRAQLRDGNPHFRSHVIVQHCCAEAWFLGHRRMMTRNPTSPDLLRFQRFFDVAAADPEGHGMPPRLRHARLHLAYLKVIRRRTGHARE